MKQKVLDHSIVSSGTINKIVFEQIYNQYWEKVYAVCYNHTKDVEVAKEMVQDIFKSLWERKNELQLQNIGHYLVRSAKFKVFEFIRNKTNRQKIDDANLYACANSSNCTEEQVLFKELKTNVALLVDTLPCQCKKVFKMSREQGMSNREIATELNITERAVEYHITKAMSVLRLKLTDYK